MSQNITPPCLSVPLYLSYVLSINHSGKARLKVPDVNKRAQTVELIQMLISSEAKSVCVCVCVLNCDSSVLLCVSLHLSQHIHSHLKKKNSLKCFDSADTSNLSSILLWRTRDRSSAPLCIRDFTCDPRYLMSSIPQNKALDVQKRRKNVK